MKRILSIILFFPLALQAMSNKDPITEITILASLSTTREDYASTRFTFLLKNGKPTTIDGKYLPISKDLTISIGSSCLTIINVGDNYVSLSCNFIPKKSILDRMFGDEDSAYNGFQHQAMSSGQTRILDFKDATVMLKMTQFRREATTTDDDSSSRGIQ